MRSAGNRQPGSRAFNPVLAEYFTVIARQVGLEPDDPQLVRLREAVEENEALLALVEGDARSPSEDPFDFVRFIRAREEKRGG